MNRRNALVLFAISFAFSAAFTLPPFETVAIAQTAAPAPTASPAPAACRPATIQYPDYQIGATLFMQKSAEFRALAYQAFNIARLRLDEDIKNRAKLPGTESSRPAAVIVDIDETVLDNSPNQAQSIKEHLGYDEARFQKWVEDYWAKPIPGAVDFLNYANSKGYTVYYVSNRKEDIGVQKAETIKNLTQAGFLNVTDQTVKLQIGKESSKKQRRSDIAKTHRIVMLLGDNLEDFNEVFEVADTPNGGKVAKRFDVTDANKASFGMNFIVLPNAIYGTWERLLYKDAAGTALDCRDPEIRMDSLIYPSDPKKKKN